MRHNLLPMSKTILSVICISVLFFSCSKQVRTPVAANTIKADFDGVTQSFPMKARALLSVATEDHEVPYAISIDGTDDDQRVSHSISIVINSDVPVAPRTYLYNCKDYRQSTNVIYQENPSYFKYAASGSSPETIVITITSLTATNVQGTFRGTIAGDGHVKKITNGQFNVNF